VITVFLIFYPVVMLSSIILPESFTEITFSGLQKEESNIVSNLGLGAFFEQHLGILLFYVFIYSVSVLGVLSQLSESLRRFLSIRRYVFPMPEFLRFFVGYVDVLTFGEIMLGGAVVLLMGSETLYFTYMHQYTQRSGNSNLEHSARVAGSLAKVTMGLLILPPTRNSVWSVAMGLSFETLIAWHRILGNLFLALIAVHVACWYRHCNPLYYDAFSTDVSVRYHTSGRRAPSRRPIVIFTFLHCRPSAHLRRQHAPLTEHCPPRFRS